jgi:hypothetical protein
MLYRIVRAVHRWYFYVVFALYVLAFFTAFALMFIPIVTIGILLASLYSLVLVVGVEKVMGWLEMALARRRLAQGACPQCASPVAAVDATRCECTGCRAVYEPSGVELERAALQAP